MPTNLRDEAVAELVELVVGGKDKCPCCEVPIVLGETGPKIVHTSTCQLLILVGQINGRFALLEQILSLLLGEGDPGGSARGAVENRPRFRCDSRSDGIDVQNEPILLDRRGEDGLP